MYGEYCDDHVSLSVCHIVCKSQEPHVQLSISCACCPWLLFGSPLVALQCVMYFCFVGDVMFAKNGMNW